MFVSLVEIVVFVVIFNFDDIIFVGFFGVFVYEIIGVDVGYVGVYEGFEFFKVMDVVVVVVFG